MYFGAKHGLYDLIICPFHEITAFICWRLSFYLLVPEHVKFPCVLQEETWNQVCYHCFLLASSSVWLQRTSLNYFFQLNFIDQETRFAHFLNVLPIFPSCLKLFRIYPWRKEILQKFFLETCLEIQKLCFYCILPLAIKQDA